MAAGATVGIRLFGEPAVVLDGATVVLPRMQGALLGALVLAGREGAHADPLADVLWPGPMPRTYETSLRVHVMKLRRSLADDDAEILVRRPQGGYALDLDVVDVDVLAFAARVEDARRDHEAGHPEAAFTAAGAALALWEGDPFLGLEDAVDAVAARSALEEHRLQACEISGSDGLRLGRSDEIIARLSPVFARSPAEERVGIPLVRALVDAGRSSEAVRVANDLQHSLRTELGVTSQVAADLTESLQRPSAPRAPRGTPPPPLAVIPSTAPFVGRDDEIDRLLGRVSAGSAGPTVTAVHGPAGIGKTRLLQELVGRAQRAGVTAVFGRADPHGAPYGALTSMVRRVGAPTDGSDLDDTLLQVVDERNGAEPGRDPGLSDHAARSRLHEGVASSLLAATPVVIAVDDAHWLDPDTASLLQTVMERATRRECHLLIGWRPGPGGTGTVEGLMAGLEDLAWVIELPLGPLTKEAAAELASEFGIADVDPVDLYERTAGNPLLVKEAARLEARRDDRSELLVDLLSRRFLAGGDARDILRTAAVLGDRFTVADLLASSDLSAERVEDALAECEREAILSIDPDGTVEFAHSVVADVVLASLSTVEVQGLHRRIFEALTRSDGEDLVHHARAAFPFVDEAEAVRSIADAASRAQRRLAFEQASLLHDQAIELLEETHALAPSEAIDLYIEQARSLAHTDETRCEEVQRRALSVAAGAASPGAVVDLAEANVGRSLSGTPELIDLLEGALQWAPAPSTAVRIRARLALEQAESDRTDGAFKLAERSLRDGRETGDLQAIGPALRAVVATGPHRLDPATYRRTVTDLIATARATPDLDLEMIGLIHLVVDRLRARETEEALSTLRGFQILADDRRWPRYQSFAVGIAAVMALTRGDLAEFERRSARAGLLAETCGFDDAAVMVAGQKVCLAWHDGTLRDLTEILTTLHTHTDGQGVVAAALACALAEDGRVDEAREVAHAIDHATLPRCMLYATCLALLASYSLTTRDRDMAESLRPEVERLSGTDIVAGAGVGHFGPAEGFVGRIRLTLGDGRGADEAFDAAAASARSHQQVLALRRLARDRTDRGGADTPRPPQ